MDILQVSIVARQQGSVLTHYHTKSGDSLELLYPGDMSAEVRKLIWSLPNSPWQSHLVSIQLTTKATTSRRTYSAVLAVSSDTLSKASLSQIAAGIVERVFCS